MKTIDYLIVGQGIAGTMLSYCLLKMHKKVLVIDDAGLSSSSAIAAGIFNPITGRRMVKTWKADTLFPFAEKVYCEMEELLKIKLLYKKNMIKFFASQRDKNNWLTRSEDSEIAKYVVPSNTAYDTTVFRKNTFGSIELRESGYVDTKKTITCFREYLRQQNCIKEEIFDYSKLKICSDHVNWMNYKAGKIIFCEGFKSLSNPYFNWLPFVPAKGDILTIQCNDLPENKIISHGLYIVPVGNNHFKVGSTYIWNEINEIPSERSKSELCQKFNKIINVKYEITDHKAGVRPTVKDRKPIVGLHPQYKCLGIFNGLGTKGVTLAPYFAEQFVNFLEYKQQLIPEVKAERFFKEINFSQPILSAI